MLVYHEIEWKLARHLETFETGGMPMESREEARKFAPRFRGGRVALGTSEEPITAICPCGKFLEVFKADETYRVYTPESLDPGITDPDMRFTVNEVVDVGTRNEIVARLVVQSHEFLDSASLGPAIDQEAILCKLHECRDLLLICERIATQVSAEVEEIKLNIDGALGASGRVINPFPQVQDLDDRSARFLVNAKRFIQLLAEVFNNFFQTDFHGPRFHQIRDWAEVNLGTDSQVYQVTAAIEPTFKYVVELRNNQEHPTGNEKTITANFQLLPHSKIQPPAWYVTGQPPKEIDEDMRELVTALLESAEVLFIMCTLDRMCGGFRYSSAVIPEEDRRNECPIKYRLVISDPFAGQ